MKQVTIGENSWHLKFNKWTYGKYYQPRNFCPYFWKTLLAFVISPLVALGKSLVYIADRMPSYDAPDWSISDNTADKIVRGLKAFVMSGGTIGLGLLGIFMPMAILIILGVAGVVGGIIGVLFLIAWIWDIYRERHPKEIKPKVYKEHVPNMTVTKARSFYHKRCPMIVYN